MVQKIFPTKNNEESDMLTSPSKRHRLKLFIIKACCWLSSKNMRSKYKFILQYLSTPIAISILSLTISPIAQQANYENQCVEGYLQGVKDSKNEVSNKRWKSFLGYSTAIRVCRRLGVTSAKLKRSQ